MFARWKVPSASLRVCKDDPATEITAPTMGSPDVSVTDPVTEPWAITHAGAKPSATSPSSKCRPERKRPLRCEITSIPWCRFRSRSRQLFSLGIKWGDKCAPFSPTKGLCLPVGSSRARILCRRRSLTATRGHQPGGFRDSFPCHRSARHGCIGRRVRVRGNQFRIARICRLDHTRRNCGLWTDRCSGRDQPASAELASPDQRRFDKRRGDPEPGSSGFS